MIYDDRKDINSHLCLIEAIELYSDRLAVHLNASKEIILEEYNKKYKLEEIPRARVTLPLLESPTAAAPAFPAFPENFGERTWHLLNERAAAAASTNNTRMIFVENRPAKAEPPPQPDNFLDAAFYIKLKANLEVILILGLDVFIHQYQFNELDDCM